MNKRTVFTRRLDIKYNLYKLLEKCSKKSLQRSHLIDHALLFSEVSILYFLSALLDIAEIPTNPYKLTNLENSFKQFASDKGNVLFTFNDLFNEGWLVKYIDEWSFTTSRSKYKGITNVDNREKQILEFIDLQTQIPYRDAISLIIDV